MSDIITADSGQTLSIFQSPGEDIRFPTSTSESLFTFGSFRLERNGTTDSLTGDSRSLSFGPYSTLDNLNVESFDYTPDYSVRNNELKLKKTDPLSYAYFSSFYTTVINSIDDINQNYPYALLSYDDGVGLSIIDYTEVQVGRGYESNFKIPYTAITNQGEVVVSSGFSENPTLVNNTDQFAIQLSGDSMTVHNINYYRFIPNELTTTGGTKIPNPEVSGSSSSLMEFKIDGKLFEIQTLSSDFTAPVYIRPTTERLNIYLEQLSRLQKQLLFDGEFLIPSAEFIGVENLRTFTWPRGIDGFNPDNQGSSFTSYLDEISAASKLVDDSKTNIMIRTMVPDNYLEQDTEFNDYTKLIATYSAQFDDIKQYIDSIAYAHTINYEEEESVPNKFLIKLSNLLGWKLSESFNEEDLFEYLVGDVESGDSFSNTNIEIWKRILVNIIWLFKKKGTRDALQFIFKLIGAPDCLINLNEFVYDITQVISNNSGSTTGSFAPEEGQVDFVQINDAINPGGPSKINENGYINYDASDFIFQEGGPGRGNGQAYINQWRPEFDPIKRADNIKVQKGEEEFFGTEHIVNTKELDINVSPARAIECDVFDWYKNNDIIWFWGTIDEDPCGRTDLDPEDYAFSALTVPFELLPDGMQCALTDPAIQNMDLNQFLDYIYANSIDPRTRKTIDQSHTSFWYQNLKNIYLTYYYSQNPRSNRVTFRSLEYFLHLLEVQFQDYFEQLIPATTIFQGTGVEYRNTVFNRQKFVYKDGINDGSEFQTEFSPPVEDSVTPIKVESRPNNSIKTEFNVTSIQGEKTPYLKMEVNAIKVQSYFPEIIGMKINPVGLSSTVEPSASNFSSFDYAVIRYKWTNEGGQDLDTRTSFINTTSVLDQTYVGYGKRNESPENIINGEVALDWGRDNKGSGFESVLINFDAAQTYTNQNTLEIDLRAFWWGERNSGDMTFEVATYSGGTMIRDGFNFINEGGIEMDVQSFSTNVVQNEENSATLGEEIGLLTYDIITKTATLTIV